MTKQRAKPNALKHGAHAKIVLLWGEKLDDYQSLRDGSFKEYEPEGESEEYLVQCMVDLLWRRRRLVNFEAAKMERQVHAIRTNIIVHNQSKILHAVAVSLAKKTTVEEVEAELATLAPMYSSVIREKWPLDRGTKRLRFDPEFCARRHSRRFRLVPPRHFEFGAVHFPMMSAA